jgi:hypothetical protein
MHILPEFNSLRNPTSFCQILTHQPKHPHLTPKLGIFQASHTILISESHVFQHLHLRIDVAIAPTTSCRGCRGCGGCGDLSTPGIGRGCRGDTSAGDRLREKGWGVNSETPELPQKSDDLPLKVEG